MFCGAGSVKSCGVLVARAHGGRLAQKSKGDSPGQAVSLMPPVRGRVQSCRVGPDILVWCYVLKSGGAKVPLFWVFRGIWQMIFSAGVTHGWKRRRMVMVGLGRLELPTSPLSGARSSHLSYRPKVEGDFNTAWNWPIEMSSNAGKFKQCA